MKFTFAEVDEGFDKHIELSIRGYKELLSDIQKLASYFLQDGLGCVDIGCSSGKLLSLLHENCEFAPETSFVGVEIEKSFFSILQERQKNSQNLSFHLGDVRKFEFPQSSLVMSIFTLQFMPYEYRIEVLQKIYDALTPGGGFIFAEKLVSESPRIQEIRNSVYYEFKLQSFSAEDIIKKEHQLRHMLKPNTRDELIGMCEEVGFKRNRIDSFWQNHAFTGFVAIK